jgi:hypothetical protein
MLQQEQDTLAPVQYKRDAAAEANNYLEQSCASELPTINFSLSVQGKLSFISFKWRSPYSRNSMLQAQIR